MTDLPWPCADPLLFQNRLARASEKYLLFEMLVVENKWYVVQYGNTLYSMYGGRLGSHLSISDVFEAVPSRVSAKRVVCAVFGVRPFSLPHALRRLLVAGVTVRGFRVPCSTAARAISGGIRCPGRSGSITGGVGAHGTLPIAGTNEQHG